MVEALGPVEVSCISEVDGFCLAAQLVGMREDAIGVY
jgi:hypothetical protein